MNSRVLQRRRVDDQRVGALTVRDRPHVARVHLLGLAQVVDLGPAPLPPVAAGWPSETEPSRPPATELDPAGLEPRPPRRARTTSPSDRGDRQAPRPATGAMAHGVRTVSSPEGNTISPRARRTASFVRRAPAAPPASRRIRLPLEFRRLEIKTKQSATPNSRRRFQAGPFRTRL